MAILVADPRTLPHPTAHSSTTGEPLSDVAHLTELLGLTGVRVGHEILPPGRRSAPAHRHTHRDELVIVAAGTPTVTVGSQRRVLNPGEIVAFPAGGPDAHEIFNDSDADVVLWSASAAIGPDTVVFAE